MKFDALRFQQRFPRNHVTQNLKLDFKQMFNKITAVIHANSKNNSSKSLLEKEDQCIEKLKDFDRQIVGNFEYGHFDIALEILLKIETETVLTYNQLSMKAECLVRLGRSSEVQVLIDSALKDDPQNHRMIYVQGLKYYYELKLTNSIEAFEQAISFDKFFMEAQNARMLAITSLRALQLGEYKR